MYSYENIVQIRCLYEGVTVEEMLESWQDMLPARMQEWALDRGSVGMVTVLLWGSHADVLILFS
jgi:hypothetical protein